MTRPLAVLLGATTMVATLDLVQKQLAVSEHGAAVLVHQRSALYVVGIAAASLAWATGVVRTRSSSIAFAGGVVLGGAAGNLVSIALWPSLPGVPDPIVVGGLAFNVADAAVVAGVATLIPATIVFGLRNRARLFQPL